MKNGSFIFYCLFLATRVQAEVLSLPEDCFSKEISPCLIRVDQPVTLTSSSTNLQLRLNSKTIVKILNYQTPYQVEMLQGDVIVQSKAKKLISFKLNEVPFVSKKIFAQVRDRKITAYDTKSFILSEYEQSLGPQQETVILKSEFPSKFEMINFVSKFYPQKAQLVAFLKSIAPAWQKEFRTQTALQTKVLQRSVASLESEEAELKRQQELQALELKKVRRAFFYRTFYR